ncbi:Lysophospholipase L1 [Halolactibacillus halophilus]|uniref:Lipase n=1 Tax=Halolactibacillus halophilus TaxID=306540 RepID=A0A1I5MW97_9BACI|nr:SGNH/GDSL hydrolase family protein [Halolactibacillus halophilus]GEM01284.1 lipase [Halolactibacillus halophilus]SFP13376.1 Lysophospholipase L1 [Halolactibacillus halophilus]
MACERIIFIGDSITEWGKADDRLEIGDNYVRMIRDHYATCEGYLPEIINKGIGGNRITDLKARWEEDVIALNPDVVSISIGINDVWRQLDDPDMDQVTPEMFETLYRDLIKATQSKTKAKIILMEPTVIEEERHSKGNTLLIPYVSVIRRLSEAYHLPLVKTHEAFLNYIDQAIGLPLTIDGVHTTSTGDTLMSETWIKTILKK